jgi:hypothetical protein
MSGNVNHRAGRIDDIGSGPKEFVDDAKDCCFVSRDRCCRDDNGITGADRDLAVISIRDPTEHRHRFALAAGNDVHDLMIRQESRLFGVNQNALRIGQESEFKRNLCICLKTAPECCDATSVSASDIDDLLDSGDQRGKGSDNNAALGPREDIFISRADDRLRRGATPCLDVNTIGDEEMDAPFGEAAQFAEVGEAAVDGRWIELEVAGVNDESSWSLDCESDRIGNAVANPERFQGEIALAIGFVGVRFKFNQLDLAAQLSFVQLRANQAKGQGGRVNLDGGQVGNEIGNRPDMIFMPMRDEDCADFVPVLAKVGDIGQNEIDAQLLFFGKAHAAIDDDNVVLGLKEKHVAANFSKAAEKDQANRRLGANCETSQLGQCLEKFQLINGSDIWRWRGGQVRPHFFGRHDDLGQSREILLNHLFDRAGA